MNKLNIQEQAKIVACLVEGCSIKTTTRLTGAAKRTITRLLSQLGAACRRFHDQTVVNVTTKRVQCDEIWSFCYAKQKNVPVELQGQHGFGDVWTWVGIDADTKLAIAWYVGGRTVRSAIPFMANVRGRLANRVQLSTDGLRSYLQATAQAFDYQVDYAMLEKLYGMDTNRSAQARYSPAKLQKINVVNICGYPDPKHISTSFSERQNLTMRMCMRRFTRLTNGFSKKIENHEAAIALHFVWYNFVRVHQTLRCPPAMEAGLADHVWNLEEMVALLG
jgi:IS1 family transposase